MLGWNSDRLRAWDGGPRREVSQRGLAEERRALALCIVMARRRFREQEDHLGIRFGRDERLLFLLLGYRGRLLDALNQETAAPLRRLTQLMATREDAAIPGIRWIDPITPTHSEAAAKLIATISAELKKDHPAHITDPSANAIESQPYQAAPGPPKPPHRPS